MLCVSKGLCDFYKSLNVGIRSKVWGMACDWNMETPNAKAFDGRSIIVIWKTEFLS